MAKILNRISFWLCSKGFHVSEEYMEWSEDWWMVCPDCKEKIKHLPPPEDK